MTSSKTKPDIILIDGNSLAYRAFYALPDTMKTSKGLVTNAIYGFTTMLLKVIEEDPKMIVIAFDKAAPTFRHKEYKEYKATRQKAPPTLSQQLPYIRKVAEAFNIPSYELEGYEADDIIGTIARQAEQLGHKVRIVTGDRDALQLVDDKVDVLATRRGITDTVIYDEKEVERQFGIKPSQIVDFKALKGDSSDNIPGIAGIGDKTATELIQKFGDLESLFKNADKIEKEKLRTKVKEGSDIAKLSKRLATIVTNVPIKVDFEHAKQTVDWKKALSFFEEFEFKSLIKKYTEKLQGADLFSVIEEKKMDIKKHKADYSVITSIKDLKDTAKNMAANKAFAFDVETDSVDPFHVNLVGISLSCKPNVGCYIPVGHNSGKQIDIKEALAVLKPLLEDPDIKKYGHNIKFDSEVVSNYGIEVKGIAFDTMVAAYTMDPTSRKYGLKPLSHGLLGKHMIEITELIGTGKKSKTMNELAIEAVSDYACSDADSTYQLVNIFSKKLKEESLEDLFYKIEVPLIEVLIKMEENGVSVDVDKLKKMSKEIEASLKNLTIDIFAIAGEEFNLNSPKQLQNILYEKLKIPITKRTKTGASTDAEVLSNLSKDFEIAAKLLEYRQLQKYKSTYIDVLPDLINIKTKRIHTSFNQTITATGRLSSSNPNLQNIPVKGDIAKKIRSAFVPAKKGWSILSADYSQIELRILAHLSNDKILTKAFLEDKDVHTATAAEVFGVPLDKVTPEMRNAAKVVNFGIIYGISEFGLSKSLNIKKTEAGKYIENYFKRYSGVKTFIDKTISQAKKDGFVCTLLGRKRPLPDINNPNISLRNFAERTAINTPVQGTAADVIKVAMINIHNILKKEELKSKLLLQVHDELVLEVPDEELTQVTKMVEHEMVNAVKLNVPAKVHIGSGNNWAEAK
ncbi:DNA polymerase I [Candidatus Margulisiibacteriota bacterium]